MWPGMGTTAWPGTGTGVRLRMGPGAQLGTRTVGRQGDGGTAGDGDRDTAANKGNAAQPAWGQRHSRKWAPGRGQRHRLAKNGGQGTARLWLGTRTRLGTEPGARRGCDKDIAGAQTAAGRDRRRGRSVAAAAPGPPAHRPAFVCGSGGGITSSRPRQWRPPPPPPAPPPAPPRRRYKAPRRAPRSAALLTSTASASGCETAPDRPPPW